MSVRTRNGSWSVEDVQFKPFVGSRKGVKGSDINLKVDGKIISNQETVVEILAYHFASIADDIRDVNVRNASVSDLNNHLSVLHIKMANCSEPMIESNPANQVQVRSALESLNTSKAPRCNNLPATLTKF